MSETVEECAARLSRLRLWQRNARTPGEREHVREWGDGVEVRWQTMVQQEEAEARELVMER